MAHYDAHTNRDYQGGYGIREPIYGGRPAAIVAYSTTSESYVASNEQVVTYSDYTTRPDQVWPRGSTHAQLKKGNEYHHSPRLGRTNGSPHDSPRKTVHSANNPPSGHLSSVYAPHLDSPWKNFRDSRGGRFSSDDDSSSDDDEVECRDGVCYPKPKHGGGQGYDYDHDKEKKKTNGHAAGNYPLQHYTDHQPRKDPHHQTSSAEKLPNGHNTHGSNSKNAPVHTKPKTDAYYDRFSYPATENDHNRNNYTHPRNETYAALEPVKTRPDRRESGRSSPVSAVAQWTPYATSPRKGHQGRAEVIDTREAQRRYGNAPPQPGRPRSPVFGEVIDSETAARICGGVFVK